MPTDDTDTTTVANRYRLDDVIGSGGVGRVWRGEDVVLRRAVAVKEVPIPTHLPDAERDALRARVLREARAAARIHHPGSVQVFDVVDEAGQVYLVMELVEDRTLAEAVTAAGPLTPQATAAMGVELLGALEAAHKVGIVHRDVKPRNVMVTPSGQVKLADFGIATMRDDPSITKTGMVMGTPSYMSPEQALGEPVGPPSDLWSTGALLYYAVEGRAPFDQGEPISTLHAVVHGEPRPFERAGVLAPVIDGLLAKDPAARLDLREATSRLATVAGGSAAASTPADEGATMALPTMTRVAPATPTAVAPAPPPDEPVRRPAPPEPVRRPAAASVREQEPSGSRFPLVAVLGVLALLGLAALLLAQLGGDDGGDVDSEAADTTVPEETTTTPVPTSAPAAVEEPSEEEDEETEEEDVASTTTTTTEPTTTTTEDPDDGGDRPEGVPASWTPYTSPTVGWTAWIPPDWTPEPVDGNTVDIEGPGGAYLRIDSIDGPGDDAVAAWEESSARFAARYPDYEEIRIEPTTYQGYEAALWEYTYQGQRATNLGIIADDIDTGFALNFQAPAGRWDALGDVRETFEDGFTIPR